MISLWTTPYETQRGETGLDSGLACVDPSPKVGRSALLIIGSAKGPRIEMRGAVVRAGDKRGVLLPRVPVDHGWDRDVFLAQTCRKAGLAADAWTHAGTQLQGFTATVFSDDPSC